MMLYNYTEAKKVANRIPWIDAVKMFAMFCVIFGHSCRFQSPDLLGREIVNQLIVAFNMPLFVFVSGLTGYKSLSKLNTWKDFSRYAQKLSERIAIPNVCFSCLCGCYFHFVSDYQLIRGGCNVVVLLFFLVWYAFKQKSSWLLKYKAFVLFIPLILNVFNKYSYFWFLSMILILMLACGFSKILLKKLGVENFAILLLLSYIIILPIPESPNNTQELMPYFLLGCITCRYDLINNLFLKHRPLVGSCTVIILLLGILAFSIYKGTDFYHFGLFTLLKNGNLYLYPIRIFCGVCFVIFFIVLFVKYYKVYGWFAKLGTQTLGLYVVHAFILDFIKISFINPNAYMWITALIVAICVTTISMIIIRIISLWNVSKAVLLGEE